MNSKSFRFLLVVSVLGVLSVVFQYALGAKYFFIVAVEAPPGITISLLQETSGDKTACQNNSENVARAMLTKCPECKVIRQECLTDLPTEISVWLGETPISIPSAHIRRGAIAFHHADSEIAVATCLASEQQAASSLKTPFTCSLPNKPRPIPEAFTQKTDIAELVGDYLGRTMAIMALVITILLAVQFATAHHPANIADSPRTGNRAFKAAKRILDVSVSMVLLLFLLPVFGVIAVLIFILEGLPIFYISRRFISIDHSVRTLKFRTMVKDATSPKYQLRERFMRDGYLDIPLTCEVYTPIGRLLERFQIVELPQLVNIIFDGMSLVGNRPLPRDNLELLSQFSNWERRFDSPAGITGISQIVGKLNITPIQRLHLESLYSEVYQTGNILRCDLAIAWFTVTRVFAKGEGITYDQAEALLLGALPQAVNTGASQ